MNTHIQLSMLLSDWLIWVLFFIIAIAAIWMRSQPHLREPWRQVLRNRIGMIAFIFLGFYVSIGLLDSIHLSIIKTNQQQQIVSTKVKTVFDLIISPLGQEDEKTYSAPFATHLFSKAVVTLPDGKEVRKYPRLIYSDTKADIISHALHGLVVGVVSVSIILFLWISFLALRERDALWSYLRLVWQGKTYIAWREGMITFAVVWVLMCMIGALATHYHILGTDKIGRDVFYEGVKSIRTGLLIGTLTTLFMLPFALVLGTFAGYFRGVTDDIIQYVYTTLSSIPGVLLITASILVLQVYITNHPKLFPTLLDRADARLLALCFILGITGWANLCRLLRAETLKLRDQEFVQAARAMGVHRFKIIWRHIAPNVMHIVLITLVLDFSGLVLAEAVLSYVGVGVDPTTMSWGNMINSSRLELAREPIVWWPLLSALIFMFFLVLSANLFADRVRDAFDPRLRE